MHRERPSLEKAALFERLARGQAEGLTVVTPNQRLSHALRAQFDAQQVAQGLKAWETGDILPFGAFIARLWDEALHGDIAADLPVPLSAVQEAALWEHIVRSSRHAAGLLAPTLAAGQCVDAWRLLHGWRLDRAAFAVANEDARAFHEWVDGYERATRQNRQTDAARLADAVTRVLHEPALTKPRTLALAGFDVVTPQARDFLAALQAAGTTVVEVSLPAIESNHVRVELLEDRHEIDAAARWARERLEANPGARIGVVVPGLAHDRARVHRAFANVMHPAQALEIAPAPMPFNLSLGTPLAAFPLVHDALRLLELAGGALPFAQASRLLRSPFVGGAETEAGVRARLDAALRKRCGPVVTLGALKRLSASPRLPRAPHWLDALARLEAVRKATSGERKPASQWARVFSDALKAAGFPGERALDSAEHQTLERWHEALAELATLDRVLAAMTYRGARQCLEAIVASGLFQPETPEVPIQVLGVLESAGLAFDHLWITGLDDESWPLPARPNPLLPIAEQKRARIPQADPISSLELDRRLTAGWLRSAREVVVSHANRRGEAELAASPLIADIPLAAIDDVVKVRGTTLRAAIAAAKAMETVEDARAPAAAPGSYAGGTGLFRDQAACPFRGFARRRLHADALETPRPGIDARDRGTLVHSLLANVWDKLHTRQALMQMDAAALNDLIAESVAAALASLRKDRFDALGERFAELERARLTRLAHDWLAIERARGDFEVVNMEQKQPVTFGGITVNVKLDRLDRLAEGGYAVLDYKTGDCKVGAWLGARPDEAQLPMYAIGGGRDVAAVAFAHVKAGELGFVGLGRKPDLLPGVNVIEKNRSRGANRYANWEALLEGWRQELEAIGRGFSEGDARVDPKRRDTCSSCDQAMLCRVAEKSPFGAAGEGSPDE
jgi:ATP-dependent helicase/nuclease subunit B